MTTTFSTPITIGRYVFFKYLVSTFLLIGLVLWLMSFSNPTISKDVDYWVFQPLRERPLFYGVQIVLVIGLIYWKAGKAGRQIVEGGKRGCPAIFGWFTKMGIGIGVIATAFEFFPWLATHRFGLEDLLMSLLYMAFVFVPKYVFATMAIGGFLAWFIGREITAKGAEVRS